MNLVLGDDVANVDADIYLMTHTTNPLMSADTIRRALESYHKAKEAHTADTLFSVNKIQTRFYCSDCSPVNHDPDYLVRTQDLEPWFEENSNLYIFSRDSFNQTQARIGKKPMMFESAPFESIDIDTPEDWDLAVVTAQYLKSKKGAAK
jgi:CMP-N-acetylneuraminic acid synthetase